MAIRTVLEYPNSRLRIKASPVKVFDQQLEALASDMLATMYAAEGIGLAATQIDVHRRVVVMDLQEEGERSPRVIINPTFEPVDEQDITTTEEGCLSLPDLRVCISRYAAVHVAWHDLQGVEHKATWDGLLAICIQHECDHLNGKVLFDYMTPGQKEKYRRELKRQRASVSA